MSNQGLLVQTPDECKSDVTVSAEFLQTRSDLIQQCLAINANGIRTEEDSKTATALKRDVTAFEKKVKEYRLQLQRPFQDVVTNIRNTINDEVHCLMDEFSKLKEGINQYGRREARRIAEENRKAEQARQAEIEKQLEMQQMESFFDPQSEPEAIEVPKVAKKKVHLGGGNQLVKTIKFEVVEKSSLPAAWVQPDERAIRNFMHSTDGFKDSVISKGGEVVKNGVRFYIEETVRTRG